MPTDELKLPWRSEIDDDGFPITIVDRDGEKLFLRMDTNRRLDDYLITAVNSHLDLTASVSELKYLLERQRDDNAALVTENERMRTCLSDIKELAANSAWGSDQDESLDTIREWAYQALTSDEKKDNVQ